MTENRFYRLGQYKIIEKHNGALWWEKTKYYYPSYTIYSCKTGRRCYLEEREKVLDKGTVRIKNNVYAEVTKRRGNLAKQSLATEVIIKIKARAAETLELLRDWLSKIQS